MESPSRRRWRVFLAILAGLTAIVFVTVLGQGASWLGAPAGLLAGVASILVWEKTKPRR